MFLCKIVVYGLILPPLVRRLEYVDIEIILEPRKKHIYIDENVEYQRSRLARTIKGVKHPWLAGRSWF